METLIALWKQAANCRCLKIRHLKDENKKPVLLAKFAIYERHEKWLFMCNGKGYREAEIYFDGSVRNLGNEINEKAYASYEAAVTIFNLMKKMDSERP